MRNNDFKWDDEACDELRRLNATGLFSSSQMASQLHIQFGGPISRNAVIGKLGRLGLVSIRPKGPAKGTPRPPRLKYRPTLTPAADRRPPRTALREPPPMPKVKFTTPDDDLAIPIEQRRTLLQLEDGMCKWPVGDPREPGFFFCGGDVVEGLSYCIGHAWRAHNEKPQQRMEAAE